LIEIDAGGEVAAIKNSFIAGCRGLSDWLTIRVGDEDLAPGNHVDWKKID